MDTPRAVNVEVAHKLLERAGEKPQKINLSNNGIELVERSALKLIGAGVVKINLSANLLASDALVVFTADSLPCLLHLWLGSNRLATITTLPPLPKLQALQLENNLLADADTELAYLAPGNFPVLTSLDLSGNPCCTSDNAASLAAAVQRHTPGLFLKAMPPVTTSEHGIDQLHLSQSTTNGDVRTSQDEHDSEFDTAIGSTSDVSTGLRGDNGPVSRDENNSAGVSDCLSDTLPPRLLIAEEPGPLAVITEGDDEGLSTVESSSEQNLQLYSAPVTNQAQEALKTSHPSSGTDAIPFQTRVQERRAELSGALDEGAAAWENRRNDHGGGAFDLLRTQEFVAGQMHIDFNNEQSFEDSDYDGEELASPEPEDGGYEHGRSSCAHAVHSNSHAWSDLSVFASTEVRPTSRPVDTRHSAMAAAMAANVPPGVPTTPKQSQQGRSRRRSPSPLPFRIDWQDASVVVVDHYSPVQPTQHHVHHFVQPVEYPPEEHCRAEFQPTLTAVCSNGNTRSAVEQQHPAAPSQQAYQSNLRISDSPIPKNQPQPTFGVINPEPMSPSPSTLQPAPRPETREWGCQASVGDDEDGADALNLNTGSSGSLVANLVEMEGDKVDKDKKSEGAEDRRSIALPPPQEPAALSFSDADKDPASAPRGGPNTICSSHRISSSANKEEVEEENMLLRQQVAALQKLLEMRDNAVGAAAFQAAQGSSENKHDGSRSHSNNTRNDSSSSSSEGQADPAALGARVLSLWRNACYEQMVKRAIDAKAAQQLIAHERAKAQQDITAARELGAQHERSHGAATQRVEELTVELAESRAFGALEKKAKETLEKEALERQALVVQLQQDLASQAAERGKLASVAEAARDTSAEAYFSREAPLLQALARLDGYASRLALMRDRLETAYSLHAQKQVQLRNETAALEASRRAFTRERKAAEAQALQGALMALPERAASFAREQVATSRGGGKVGGGAAIFAAQGECDSAEAVASAAVAQAVEEVLALLRPSRAKRTIEAQGSHSNKGSSCNNKNLSTSVGSDGSSLSQQFLNRKKRTHPIALCGLRPDCEALLRASFKKLDPTGKGTVPAAQLLHLLQEQPPPSQLHNITTTTTTGTAPTITATATGAAAIAPWNDSFGPKSRGSQLPKTAAGTTGGTGALRRVMEAWVGEEAWTEALAYLANAFDQLPGQDADLTWGEFLLYFVPSDDDDDHDDNDDEIHSNNDGQQSGDEIVVRDRRNGSVQIRCNKGNRDEGGALSEEALCAARTLLSNLSVPELRQEASMLLVERAALRKQLAYAERRCEHAGESAWQLHRQQITVLEAKSQQLNAAAGRSQADAAAATSHAESASAKVAELQEQLKALEAEHRDILGQASQSTAAKQAAEERADANAREASRARAGADVIQSEVADLRRAVAAAEVEAAAANRQLERTTEERTAAEASLRRQLRDATQERNLALAQLKHLENTAAVRRDSSLKTGRASGAAAARINVVVGGAAPTPPIPKPSEDAQDATSSQREKQTHLPQVESSKPDLRHKGRMEHYGNTDRHEGLTKGCRSGAAASASALASDDSSEEEPLGESRSLNGTFGARSSRQASRQSNRKPTLQPRSDRPRSASGDSKTSSRNTPTQQDLQGAGGGALSSRLAGLAALTDAILSSDSD